MFLSEYIAFPVCILYNRYRSFAEKAKKLASINENNNKQIGGCNMAQHSGFFNALKVDGIADRRYNANDYCDNLAAVIGNGVLRSINDDLKVTTSGMTVTVGAGRAWINGHYYHNDSPVTFTAPTAPTGGSRYDRVVLRLNTDISARKIELVYVQGTAANTPTKPNPVREGGVYDLVIADIFVGTNATSVGVTDTRGNGTVCSGYSSC